MSLELKFENALVINIGKLEPGKCVEEEKDGVTKSKIKSNYAIYFGSDGTPNAVALEKNTDLNEIVKQAYDKLKKIESNIMRLILTGNILTVKNTKLGEDAVQVHKDAENIPENIKEGLTGDVEFSFVEDTGLKNPTIFTVPSRQTLYIVTSGMKKNFTDYNPIYERIENVQNEVCQNWPPKTAQEGTQVEEEREVDTTGQMTGGRRRSRRGRGKRAVRRTRKGNRTKKGLGRVRSSRRGRGRGRRTLRSRRR